MKTAVIYARVSSTNDRQCTQRQIEDLTRFANINEYTIVNVYEEHISLPACRLPARPAGS